MRRKTTEFSICVAKASRENNRILKKYYLKKLIIGSSLVGDFKEVPLGLSHLWPLTYIYNGEESGLDLRNPGQWPWLHWQLALCPWEKFFTLLYHLCELLWRSSEKTWRHSPSHSFLHSSPDFFFTMDVILMRIPWLCIRGRVDCTMLLLLLPDSQEHNEHPEHSPQIWCLFHDAFHCRQ